MVPQPCSWAGDAVKALLAAVAFLAVLLAPTQASSQPSPAETHTGPVVCHFGWHCHQVRTVAYSGRSLVTFTYTRHAPTIVSSWSPWTLRHVR